MQVTTVKITGGEVIILVSQFRKAVFDCFFGYSKVRVEFFGSPGEDLFCIRPSIRLETLYH